MSSLIHWLLLLPLCSISFLSLEFGVWLCCASFGLAIVLLMRGYGPGGGGGTLVISSYVGSGPTSTVHPKNISGISSTPKIFELLATQKNIPNLYLDL